MRMIKIKKSQIILFLLSIIVLVIVSSCTKPQCKASSDCESKACFLSKCEDKKCVYALQRNCCGNRLIESVESGKPGNKCTCPQDYGECEGKGKIKIGSRTDDAAYAHYFCNSNNQCVSGADEKDISQQNVLDTISSGFFKASSVIKYNKPFDIASGNFEFTLSLDDVGKDLILPVAITNIKLLFSSEYARVEQLIAEKELDVLLNGVGDKQIITTPLTFNYKPQQVEELGSLRYSIGYTYTKRVPSGRAPDGTTLYTQELVRATFTAPAKPVLFIRSE